MRLKIKNNKNILLSNGTFLDYGNEVTNEIVQVMKANKVNPDIMNIVLSISTDAIVGMYRKLFESDIDDDVDFIK